MDDGSAIRYSAGVAGLLFLIMTSITLVTGVSQQWFEQVHGLDEYTRRMSSDAGILTIILSFDDMFIAAYVVATVALARGLARASGPWSVVALTAACLGGLLDYVENHHMLSQLRWLEAGGVLSSAAIQAQMIVSSLKWMLGHLAFVAIAFALQPRATLDRLFQLSLIGVQLPMGVLVWTQPNPLWYWSRALCFLAGFVYVAARARTLVGEARAHVDVDTERVAP